ncbi:MULTISPECIES: LPS export ABC transporter ATP-binding protein [Fibrobacter]|uniref:Lipopolysaccharide export system ATP-binding protein n=1 Tax=Fibrobacter intestinalis TaxID=28122 RepID=A0A1M6T8R2_9BACT|nr:LPS export ABC transporter ATP-binding protein [Fibrobacter intestinalis]PBC69249.1 lipopolysaccharide export system ATP-binding protein [Fibrobacter sp. UWS1]PBC74447.1 lipopolysaccharide export system ATP-binding protein [Fibrobacter sp. NR9]SHK53229.1 lipopolysaccharide export system ATP-binding protein [Fibrobacter intestinalis]SJZ81938.1 lipopolysaccharide export system ATP-binding protein [Fibrobacter intestinalis]
MKSLIRTIRTDKICKIYNGRKVVNNVSISVSQGEIVGLLGPNGAGKTTSFYMIVGMVRPDSGHIFLDDVEMTEKPMFRRARLGVGYLPQEASIFRKLSVQDNIMAILETQNYKRSERKERLEQLLEEFKITHIRKTKAMSCSGGERRRLEIARALAANPDFLLLDEPFAGIDPIAVGDIQAIISSLREKGMGILITDHNVRETLSITDRAYIMYKSQVLTEGSSDFLANNEEAKRIYLGESFRLD